MKRKFNNISEQFTSSVVKEEDDDNVSIVGNSCIEHDVIGDDADSSSIGSSISDKLLKPMAVADLRSYPEANNTCKTHIPFTASNWWKNNTIIPTSPTKYSTTANTDSNAKRKEIGISDASDDMSRSAANNQIEKEQSQPRSSETVATRAVDLPNGGTKKNPPVLQMQRGVVPSEKKSNKKSVQQRNRYATMNMTTARANGDVSCSSLEPASSIPNVFPSMMMPNSQQQQHLNTGGLNKTSFALFQTQLAATAHHMQHQTPQQHTFLQNQQRLHLEQHMQQLSQQQQQQQKHVHGGIIYHHQHYHQYLHQQYSFQNLHHQHNYPRQYQPNSNQQYYQQNMEQQEIISAYQSLQVRGGKGEDGIGYAWFEPRNSSPIREEISIIDVLRSETSSGDTTEIADVAPSADVERDLEESFDQDASFDEDDDLRTDMNNDDTTTTNHQNGDNDDGEGELDLSDFEGTVQGISMNGENNNNNNNVASVAAVAALAFDDDSNIRNEIGNDTNRINNKTAHNIADKRLPSKKRATDNSMQAININGDNTNDNSRIKEVKFRAYQAENWTEKFEELLHFRELYGHCLVPNCHPNNPALAQWTKRQRYQYKLKVDGKRSTITDERVRALDEVGFVWDSHKAVWAERLEELKDFKKQFGHCNVPSRYQDNHQLAIWVKRQRRQWKNKMDSLPNCMTDERQEKLEKIGFVWDMRRQSMKTKARSLTTLKGGKSKVLASKKNLVP